MAPKKQRQSCPHRSNIMTPCFREDGDVALKGGVCQGCGKTPAELETDGDIKIPETMIPVIRKINSVVNDHAKKMKATMVKALIEGKMEGWDTKPAWQLTDSFDEHVNMIREGKNIPQASVGISIDAALIAMRQK